MSLLPRQQNNCILSRIRSDVANQMSKQRWAIHSRSILVPIEELHKITGRGHPPEKHLNGAAALGQQAIAPRPCFELVQEHTHRPRHVPQLPACSAVAEINTDAPRRESASRTSHTPPHGWGAAYKAIL